MLENIITGKVSKPFKVIIYGTSGVGKTTWASQAPAPIIIQTEQGADEIGCARFPLSKSFDDIIAIGTSLLKEEHEYKTLIIDSMDHLERLVHADLCEKYNAQSITDDDCKAFGYGKAYHLALSYFNRIVKMCDALGNKGMNIIMISHADVKPYNDPRCDPYDRFTLKMHKTVSALLTEYVDGVFFAGLETMTREVEVGFNKKISKGLSTGTRILHTEETPAFVAKNRWSLPAELPLDFAAFMEAKNKE